MKCLNQDFDYLNENSKGAFSRAKIYAKVFAKVARLTIYCNDFSWDYNGFSILIDS